MRNAQVWPEKLFSGCLTELWTIYMIKYHEICFKKAKNVFPFWLISVWINWALNELSQ